MQTARFLLPLLFCLGALTLMMVPVADKALSGWMMKDLRLRSTLVAASVEGLLSAVADAGSEAELDQKLTRLAGDERIVGIGICDAGGKLAHKSAGFPPAIACGAAPADAPVFSAVDLPDRDGFLAAFAHGQGAVLVVHDMSYVARRIAEARGYAAVFVLAVILLAALVTLVAARVTMRGWMSGLRKYLETGDRAENAPVPVMKLIDEVQSHVRKLEKEYRQAGLTNTHWSAETLHDFVKSRLPSEQLISVSFRQPYSHVRDDAGNVAVTTPASGLVTALEPIMKACSGTWIAVSTGNADREMSDASGSVMVPPQNPAYKLRRLWLSPEEEAGFYAGFANEGIWPLCNIAYVKPRFRAADWEHYKAVNRRFADAIAAEATSDRPIVFIQDYHFAMLPQYVREKLPDAVIICFWHIPWPNSEVFGINPWRREFLSAMLHADIIGFHTRFMCNNFLDCVDTSVEALIDRETSTVMRHNGVCMVRTYPISIAWPENPPAETAAACRDAICAEYGLGKGRKIILGVERLDYVKGIPERLNAFEYLLEHRPDWRGRVTFLQIASPSRSIIEAYANLSRDIEVQAEQINAKYGTEGWTPVILLKKNFSQPDLYRFYRACEACVISSLHDGMNLVAKEFISSRDDERGVLVLSQFAGASRELPDALIINPYDEEGLAAQLARALEMPAEEQTARMRVMREQVKTRNVYAWAGSILGDGAALYNRRQLEKTIYRIGREEAVQEGRKRHARH